MHRTLGPGLLESAYHACLLYELRLAGLKVISKQKLPVVYKAAMMDCYHELDLLLNLNVPIMKEGITRKLNQAVQEQ